MALMVVMALIALLPKSARAHDAMPHDGDVLGLVRFDQRLDEQVPTGIALRDENDQLVELHSLRGDKPVLVALSYFECETLCPLVRHGLVEALRPLAFSVGNEFDVLLVSIDPAESAATAAAVKQETLEAYGRAASAPGWHFLRGDHDTIDRLADAIGFRYAYDGEQDEYAHPSGVVLLTPEGRISRYFFGIEYEPQDLRLGLVEASQNKIGNAIDQIMLLCYHYDPTVGKYTLLVMNVIRTAAAFTVAAIGALIFMLWRKESQRATMLG
jgi:protein SCO1/2